MKTINTQPTTITRGDFNDNMNFLAHKLKFMNDAILAWNYDAIDFKDDNRLGFSCIMDDIILDLEKNVKNLE